MKYPENIREVATYKPDYMGFIFYKKSKRFIGEDFDTSVLKDIDHSIKRVGVFVNHSNNYIEEKVKRFGFDLLQLHGDESVKQCQELKAKGYKIVKVFQVDGDFEFAVTESYKKYVDYFLFDTKSEGYGGTGKEFDWNIFDRYDNEVPLFLSGGVGIESLEVIEKLTHLNIHALDINSKFELEPGRKDIKKVKLFIDSIRNEILS